MEILDNKQRELPNSTLILVLGILALVFCWCYGFIGLVLGIIAVALAGTQRRMYEESPGEYTESSYRNVNTGRVCGIIAICLSCAVVILLVLVVSGIVAMGLGAAALGM